MKKTAAVLMFFLRQQFLWLAFYLEELRSTEARLLAKTLT